MNTRSSKISASKWFLGFALYVAILSLLLAWSISNDDLPFWEEIAGGESTTCLVIFTLCVSLACTFCPIPILGMFLWIGRAYNPFLIALIGSAATSIANLHDYYILNSLMRWERLAKAKSSAWYKKSAEWFNRFPFLALTAANFLPLPVDVVRLLAISTGYSRVPFTAASFTGRYPRYLILAALGYELKPSNRAIVIIILATIIIALIKSYPKLKQRIAERMAGRKLTEEKQQHVKEEQIE